MSDEPIAPSPRFDPVPVTPTPIVAPPAVTLLEPRFPVSTFDHGVAGADPLVAGGTRVPKSLVSAIEKAAWRAGIRVVEVLEDDVAQPVAHLFRRVIKAVETF